MLANETGSSPMTTHLKGNKPLNAQKNKDDGWELCGLKSSSHRNSFYLNKKCLTKLYSQSWYS